METVIFTDSPFKVSKKTVRKWFKYFNDEIFEGQLKQFRTIRIFKSGKDWAECFAKWSKVRGNRYCDLKIRQKYPSIMVFYIVLVHEMVHSYQWQELKEMNHGQSFFAWKSKLAEYHIPLEIKIGDEWQVITK